MDAILSEQKLQVDGLTDVSQTALKIGKLLNAELVVFGLVTSVTESKVDRFSYDVLRSEVSVDVRVVNATTGQVVISETAKGTAEDKIITTASGTVVKGATDYDALHVPRADPMTLDELARAPLPRDASIVLYSEGGVHSAQAWVLLRLRGYRDVRFLREGIYEWLARVLEPRLATDATAAERADFARAEQQSRFFGGQPRSGVPRSEVPTGYWTNASAEPAARSGTAASGSGSSAAEAIRATVGRVRRRGC